MSAQVDRFELEFRLGEALERFKVYSHYVASAEAGSNRYAVFEGKDVHGEPTDHRSAQRLRQQLTVTAIVETLEEAGIVLPGGER